MESKRVTPTNELRKTLDLYLSRWLLISFFVIISLGLAYSYLRYSTNLYQASATIKIKEEKESQKLPSMAEISKGGLFSDGNKIADEVKVLTSRNIFTNIVKNLNLNIRFYEEGKIKEKELYENPPLKLNFFATDSIIHGVDTLLFIKIKSPTEFLMFKDDAKSIVERDDSEGKLFSFGDRIKTGFGDMVIVPNVGEYAPNNGSNLKVAISSVNTIANFYQSQIATSTEVGSSVIKLTLRDNNPKKAVDILDQVIREYNNDVIEDKEDVLKVTSTFINNRLELVFKELEEVDFTAEQLQKRNNLTALNSQANIYLESEKQNEVQISNTTNTIQLIDYLQQEVKEKNKNSDLLPSNFGIADANVNQITKSHNELVAQRDKLLKNSSEKNPIVINLNNQISALKGNLESSLENIKRSSEITLNSLYKEDARIGGQLFTAPTKQRQLRDIERQQNIKESLYLYLLEKREESAIRLGMFSPNAKIIDTAYSTYVPVAPNRMITYLGALILGLMIPVAFIYTQDLLDTKIYDKDDLIQSLNIPYIGDIPKTSSKTKLINRVDYSPKAEAFRIIRSNIDFILKDVGSKTKKVFITSTRAQEGKSHTSTNLASSISFSEKMVLLIEMDIRVPTIMKYLKEDSANKVGLSDYLADNTIHPDEIVTKLKNNNFLNVISSGTIPPNPSELLMSKRVEELFEYFEQKYDYIIVDVSAVGLVSDTLLVSKFADMFIYVVSADNIDKRHLVAVAKPLFEDNRLPRMNMLLNGTNFDKKGYGYGYGYGNNPNKKKKWYHFK
jgi:capsular exopolysaccharide synthesis family protein